MRVEYKISALNSDNIFFLNVAFLNTCSRSVTQPLKVKGMTEASQIASKMWRFCEIS